VERVSFLIESTGVRLACLLNPEMLVIRRTAGVRPRRSPAGQLTGAALADDPLLYTGGGQTVVDLDLLFDVSLAGSSITTEDVRDLTSPLWNLAENAVANDGFGRPTLVRFVWGKSWNIPGIVAAVAERLENFTPEGQARRSWLRMRLMRVGEPVKPLPARELLLGPGPEVPTPEALAELPPDDFAVREVHGGEGPSGAERLDSFLARNQIEPRFWKVVAALNGIADPFEVDAATQLRLPPPAALEGGR
jgi:hypothetical protein